MLFWCLLGIAGTKLAALELLLAPPRCSSWRLSVAHSCLHAACILSKQNMEFLIMHRNAFGILFARGKIDPWRAWQEGRMPACKGRTCQCWRGGMSLQAFLEGGVQQSKVWSSQLFILVGCCYHLQRSHRLGSAKPRRGPLGKQDTLAWCLGNVKYFPHPHMSHRGYSRPARELSVNFTFQAYYSSLPTWHHPSKG